MNYEVSEYYCAACNTTFCFGPNSTKHWIELCFINNTNWCEGKF